MGTGEATPVHAVLVSGDQAGVREAGGDFAQAAEAFLFVLVFSPWLLGVGHDAHNLRSQSLHTGDAALDFTEGHFKVTIDVFCPAADQGAELSDADARVFKLAAGRVEFRVTQVVDVFAIDAACGNILPAQFLGRFDLGGEIGGCFVGESGEFHTVLVNTASVLLKFRFFQSGILTRSGAEGVFAYISHR